MPTTLKDKLATFPRARRARIEAEADRLHAEYLTLQELRKAREKTQVEMAETLGVAQASIAKLEQRSDLLLSTLRGYVEAMGGTLTLSAEFPDRAPVQITGLGALDEPK